jgi:hypothetical protein
MRSAYYDGSPNPEPVRVKLRAGSVSLEFEDGMLRYLCVGSIEVLRGIYAAVRDHNWETVPGELRDVDMDVRPQSFVITFTSDHRRGDLHFVWNGEIRGTAAGVITYSFDGEAKTAFRRNRIGFCILHPMTAAGKSLMIEHTDGSVEASQFPLLISPHQPCFDICGLRHEAAPGLWTEVRMVGETFEMEDQRNWTDASFKTYCTPLALPFPVQVNAGEHIYQSVTIRVSGASEVSRDEQFDQFLELDSSASTSLPAIGLCWSSDHNALTDREIDRLQALRLNHIRYDLHFDSGWQDTLGRVLKQALRICSRLELAVHLSHRNKGAVAQDELSELQRFFTEHRVSGWVLVFRDGEIVTHSPTFALASAILEHQTIGMGTDAFFTELNRNRPDDPTVNLLAFSVNPQVHAFDNASLVESIPVLSKTVESAFGFLRRKVAIHVTPVTLKMRWNPNATGPEMPTPANALPQRVDPRQMSLFGAGWTMGAIRALAQGGAHSITFYETVGWLGVMERDCGSPLPVLFPSVPGAVFPMYHVFASISEFVEATTGNAGVVQVPHFTSSNPLQFSGLALQAGSRLRLLIANHTQQPQSLLLRGISGAYSLRRLDEASVVSAMRDPEGFLTSPAEIAFSSENALRLHLSPYALTILDRLQ